MPDPVDGAVDGELDKRGAQPGGKQPLRRLTGSESSGDGSNQGQRQHRQVEQQARHPERRSQLQGLAMGLLRLCS